jgi:hypothetical protein
LFGETSTPTAKKEKKNLKVRFKNSPGKSHEYIRMFYILQDIKTPNLGSIMN